MDFEYDLDALPTNPVPDSQLGVQDITNEEPIIEEKVTKKPRVPNFDPQKLVAESGLPDLRKQLLRAKFKHKKQSRKDLVKLYDIYKLWGHKVFPRTTHRDLLPMLVKAGSDYHVRSFRRELVDKDKFGDIASNVEGLPAPESPNADAGDLQLDTLPAPDVESAPGNSNAPAALPAPDSDPDSPDLFADDPAPTKPAEPAGEEFPIDELEAEQENINTQKPTNDDEDQWNVFRELGL